MRTRTLPFQIEQTTSGTFVLQGITGGMLTGFLLAVAIVIAYPHPSNILIGFYILPIMLVTGVLGLFKSLPLGTLYHVTGIRMPALVRIAISTVVVTLLVSFFKYESYADEPRLLVTVAGWSLLLSLPTAVLVGSNVRPWKIFTYWRVTFREHGIKQTLTSSGIRILGVLPLRLLSIGGFIIWIAPAAAASAVGEEDLTQLVIFYLIPLTYFALSTYLTFSSPSQLVLVAIGLVSNAPITYLSLFGYVAYPESLWSSSYIPTVLAIADSIFICAWVAFGMTRFLVQPKDFLPAGLEALLKSRLKHNHHCLGSRFIEWQTAGEVGDKTCRSTPHLRPFMSRELASRQR